MNMKLLNDSYFEFFILFFEEYLVYIINNLDKFDFV